MLWERICRPSPQIICSVHTTYMKNPHLKLDRSYKIYAFSALVWERVLTLAVFWVPLEARAGTRFSHFCLETPSENDYSGGDPSRPSPTTEGGSFVRTELLIRQFLVVFSHCYFATSPLWVNKFTLRSFQISDALRWLRSPRRMMESAP